MVERRYTAAMIRFNGEYFVHHGFHCHKALPLATDRFRRLVCSASVIVVERGRPSAAQLLKLEILLREAALDSRQLCTEELPRQRIVCREEVVWAAGKVFLE